MSSSDLRSVAAGRFQLVEVNDAMPSFLRLLLAVLFFTFRVKLFMLLVFGFFTTKRILERLGIRTSSSFVKI